MATGSKKVIYAALVGNALIAITKFIAASITGSSAMLSEGIHSLVDTGNQVLLLNGLKRAQKPPDKNFPFGYGKEIYFWSFIVALMLFSLGGLFSIYEGWHKLSEPGPLRQPWIALLVLDEDCAALAGLALAFVFVGLAAWTGNVRFDATISSRGFARWSAAIPRSRRC